jgi:cell division protein FtsW (lipid II flippase)
MKPRFCAASSFVPVAMILGSIAGLAAMGLMFCWVCPDRLHDVDGIASHWCFKRQLAWNVVGLAAFCLAVVLGWKRWLKAALVVFVGWIALWFIAHVQPLVDGSSTFVRIGPISLGVWSLFPVALALLAAWLRNRYGERATRILLIAGVVSFATVTAYIAMDDDRMTRLTAFVAGERSPDPSPGACARGFVQSRTRKALAQAQWFSSTDAEILRETPGNATYSMPASSAVMFGKWFMSVAWVFFAVIALCLVFLGRRTEDREKRAFFIVFGLGIIVPSLLGHCECLGLVPMLYTSVPLLSNDTAAVLASWLGAGIFASAFRVQEDAEFPIPPEFPSSMAYLRDLVAKGASARWGVPLPRDVADRLEFELFTIGHVCRKSRDVDIALYFLMVQDYVAVARRMGVWVGPGRGSAPGSAVAYALGITAVDPIRHGLLFEAFLNPDEVSMPDIAIDFDDMGREKVLRYIVEKHGRGDFNVLASATLSRQKECVRLVKERTGKSIDLDRIPEDDDATLSVFANADTAGIFQPEPDGLRKWLKELKVSCFTDIVTINALCRPVLLEYVPTLVRRKNGEALVEYDHPLMEDILHETYGVTVYLEQVILLSRKLAGFTRVESGKMRKAMGTKRLDEMEGLKSKFVAGCLANPSFRIGKWVGETEAEKLIEKIWDDWRSFAPYALNKSHAVCCAWLAYQSAYLKAHYPTEFAKAYRLANCSMSF